MSTLQNTQLQKMHEKSGWLILSRIFNFLIHVSFFCDIESLYRKRWRGFSFQCLVKSMHKCRFICFCSFVMKSWRCKYRFLFGFFLSFFLNIFVLYVVEEVLLIFCVEFFFVWFYEKTSQYFFCCPQQLTGITFFIYHYLLFDSLFSIWKKADLLMLEKICHDWLMIDSEWGIEWGLRHHIFCNNCSKNLHFFIFCRGRK